MITSQYILKAVSKHFLYCVDGVDYPDVVFIKESRYYNFARRRLKVLNKIVYNDSSIASKKYPHILLDRLILDMDLCIVHNESYHRTHFLTLVAEKKLSNLTGSDIASFFLPFFKECVPSIEDEVKSFCNRFENMSTVERTNNYDSLHIEVLRFIKLIYFDQTN